MLKKIREWIAPLLALIGFAFYVWRSGINAKKREGYVEKAKELQREQGKSIALAEKARGKANKLASKHNESVQSAKEEIKRVGASDEDATAIVARINRRLRSKD